MTLLLFSLKKGNITFAQFCDTLEKIDIDEKMSMKFLT